jgi:ParB/RepB/Spo0J family partition protein
MGQVDQLQEAEEAVAQQREAQARQEAQARADELRRAPLAATAQAPHTLVMVPLSAVRTMVNMRVGALPDVQELAVSIKETGLLHPPLVRATEDPDRPYELLAGRRRFAAMALLDEADGPRDEWRFTLVEGISTREALTMQFAENFHQAKPEPVQFARAARAIMAEDPSLSAADVSRLVGAPVAWTRKALKLLDLPAEVLARVEQGDLSFTVAELVRKGIAKGAVSEQEAVELVDRHAAGQITGGSLKLGVGYVPPKPADYDEQSRKLDQARWAKARDSDRADDAEQRDWDARAAVPGSRPAARPATAAPEDEPQPRPFAAGAAAALPAAELDGYLLGVVLDHPALAVVRANLGIAGAADAHAYAHDLAPAERQSALRALAAELLAADPAPPAHLRRALRAAA